MDKLFCICTSLTGESLFGYIDVEEKPNSFNVKNQHGLPIGRRRIYSHEINVVSDMKLYSDKSPQEAMLIWNKHIKELMDKKARDYHKEVDTLFKEILTDENIKKFTEEDSV